MAQQRTASGSVLAGLDYFRLVQALTPGDIFELDVGAQALAIGPDSDISEVRAQYLDPLNPGGAGIVDVSVARPFIGRLDSLPTKSYEVPLLAPPQRGVILISPSEVIINPYTPITAGAASIIHYPPPVIDFIAYNGVPAQVPPARTPKLIRSVVTIDSSGDPTFFVVPIYGRRFFNVRTLNLTAQPATLTITIRGVNADIPSAPTVSTLLLVPTAIPVGVGASLNFPFLAEAVGAFDLLEIAFDNTAAAGLGGAGLRVHVRATD